MSVEDYTEEFNNLSVCVGLLETAEQLTTSYLAGLGIVIRDEHRVGKIVTLEDAY